MTTVVHCKKAKFDVYIGRPGKWGNPFVLSNPNDDNLRAHVLRKYEDYIRSAPGLMADLYQLKGKVLGCYCHPKPCHGDILAKLADALPKQS